MKKTKLMTKVMAVVFALAILFAMSVPAFAVDDKYTGTPTNNGISGTTNIPITKGIVMFNPDGSNVRVPAIKFVYNVAPVTNALGTITDAQNNTVTVNAGVSNGVTGTTVVFNPSSDAVVAAKALGTEVERTDNLTVNFGTAQAPTFTHAGVFRYLITETITDLSDNPISASDLPNYGFEARNGYSDQRYLDVYIENDNTTTPPSLKLTAAVIFKTDAVDNNSNEAKNAITTTTDKTTGFEPGVPSTPGGTTDYTTDTSVDRYFTYNLQVGKTTTGNLADMNHDFPFVITLAADANLVPTVTADFVNNNATSLSGVSQNNTIDITKNSNTVVGASMSNGDSITINGLPKGTTVTVKETNDTHDEYTASWDTMSGTTTNSVTFTDANGNPVNTNNSGYAMAFNNTITSSAVAVDGGQTTSYVKTVLGYTNDITDISPTGLVFRVAPYVLMLLAGVSLIVLFAKRRREITDMI